ncbi:FHY3/FAR1 family protein [Dioscorea alata]|uniref:FHY3/FAR1 family protein n=1 Tax=Dioscorea alata TaxID=55571 RepID=A0ACB7URB7_DIOAL|nr:FHY3/FAR1 family protein [Dioscorea alata]
MQSVEDIAQLPTSPSIPVPSSSNSSHPTIYPSVKEEFIPKIQQIFANLSEVERFYNDYARQAGFSTRANSSRTSKDGEITRKEFVCYKQGRNQPTTNPSCKRRRGIIRECCPAKLAVVKKREGFQVSLFVEGHNHVMTSPGRVHLLPSHRKVTAAQKSLTRQLGEANVPPCQKMRILELQCGGIENVGFTQRDLYNAERDRRNSIGGHDADMFYEYLKSEQENNSAFTFKIETDDENRLTHCFWADATCRKSYKYFGDVVVFDTTYNTNKYCMVLAPIVGVNHHGRTTVFGCALLSKETIETFEWFFREWLKAMPAGPPKLIITDQDPAMAKAIERTLPRTTHRLCIWHIMNKFPEKISGQGWLQYSDEFKKCIWNSETAVEFEARWVDLVQKSNLTNNQWLKDMYTIREKWIPAYTKHIFAAHMSSSQRVEGEHAFFKRFVSKENSLLDFVTMYDKALTHIRHNELELDHKDANEKPVLKTSWGMEKKMSQVYTRSVFYKFQEQIHQVLAYVATKMDENENFMLWKVEREEDQGSKSHQVAVEKASNCVSCNCNMFEFDGIPCRHMLAYFNTVQIKQLPDRYILPRWTVSAKASRVMDDLGAARGTEINDGSVILRRHELFHVFSEVVDHAVLTEDGTQIVKEALKLCKNKLCESPRPCEEGEFSAIHVPISLRGEPSVKEPLRVKAKGGGKRLKGGKEKAMEKGLRKCNFCNRKGQKHDKRNCPLRLVYKNIIAYVS